MHSRVICKSALYPDRHVVLDADEVIAISPREGGGTDVHLRGGSLIPVAAPEDWLHMALGGMMPIAPKEKHNA